MSAHSSGTREIGKQRTRRRILAKATRLCARNGFSRTRTLEVARAARVSHGSVFVHFRSRDELLSAVVSEMTREITDALHAQVASGASLTHTLAAHLECLAEREQSIRWLLLEIPLLPRGVHAPWLAFQSATSFHIGQAAERDMAAGSIEEMPLHLLFNTWIGLVNHYVINRELFAPNKSALRVHGPVLLEHFSNLISAPASMARRRKGTA